jgi:hypothetical protein
VQERFYSNRTDFIRTAIRNQLTTHGEAVSKSIDRRWRPGRAVPLDLVPAALS